ncbi:MAG: ACT domain-containing protein [Phycisphaerales bacterium JB050]
MRGEERLNTLLRTLRTSLVDGVFVFASVPSDEIPPGVAARMVFQEAEGTTLVLLRQDAIDAGLAHEFPCRMITLDVHSSLEAVGFMARVASALAEYDIAVNPVSGFYHDHLFVPEDRVTDALGVLERLSRVASVEG